MKRILFILSLLGLGCLPFFAHAATLTVSPSSTSVKVGQTFTVSVRVNSADQSINAAEATVAFPTDLLQAVSVNKSGSIFRFWTTEPSASSTRLVFSGGVPNPGYTGNGGTIVSMSMKAKAVGKATIQISGGRILANDGLGTNILTGQGSVTITIAAATVEPEAPAVPTRPTPSLSSTSHPDQTVWYHSDTASMVWTRPNGMTGVSYVFSQNSTATPGDQVTSTNGSTTVSLPSDGVWYFVIRGKYDSGWSSTGRYIIRRDTTPPAAFPVTITRARGDTDPAPVLTFTTTDSGSGIDHYTATLDTSDTTIVTSPYKMTLTKAGHHRVIISAYDRSGLKQESVVEFTMTGYAPPVIVGVNSPMILLDSLVVHGTAASGDRVAVYVNDQPVGEIIAGPVDNAPAGVTVRVPWTLTTDRAFRPGQYQVTATAQSADGQISVPTDPVPLVVSGHAILLAGRPIATLAAIPAVVIAILILLLANVGVLVKMFLAARQNHRREDEVERELEVLRSDVLEEKTDAASLGQEIASIEDVLEPKRRRQVPGKRRKSRRT